MYAGAIILFGPLFVQGGLVLLAGFGLAMAPPIGFLCAWLARKKKLSAQCYGAAGAAYTVLFFLPGAYFAFRLLGRQVSPSLVRAGYILLYGLWAFGPLGKLIVSSMIDVVQGTAVDLLILATISMIVISGCLLYRRYSANNALGVQRAYGETGSPQDPFLAGVYLAPFVGVYISIILDQLFFYTYSPFAHLVE